ncbi:glycosyltransferase family 4 protein [Actinomyces slackii]|uniref:Sugar transferase, PEP-CTERM/EpsH1 system associated n=1 Tax=Actinomyces slackii TaxID=52774 RepID=A0A448KG14_9ACTO|nr:glycosyltransferase family 4 protein [Actinomyces slackii]VEG75859.1 sugar transferase, PEP-CTERM/EpsH1 system associated [Actinomyces slackii]
MRLAFISNTYPPRSGGLEQHIQNLARGLAEQGHTIYVLTISDEPGRRMDGQVRVLTGRCHLPIADVISYPGLGTTGRLAAFLRAEGIQAVSTHTRFFPMSLIGLRAARRAGLPTIHTEHGSGFVASGSPLIAIGSRAVDLTAGRYVLRAADRVLAVSPQAAQFVERLSGARAEVFYNAITPPRPGADHLDRPHHLVFVGRVVAGKGWDTFLEAMAALRRSGVEVDGELLGDGADLGAARRRAGELGLSGVVSIPGRVSPDQVRASLDGATLVNPTVLSEGFQTTLLETIAEGGRVVTFDVPGAQLLADSGAPVVICRRHSPAALAESIRALIAAPPAAADPELIAPWTWPVRTGQYARIVQEVLAGRAG